MIDGLRTRSQIYCVVLQLCGIMMDVTFPMSHACERVCCVVTIGVLSPVELCGAFNKQKCPIGLHVPNIVGKCVILPKLDKDRGNHEHVKRSEVF